MGALKVISFLNRREDLSLAQFSDYWRTVHRAHALKLVEAGFIQGYIQNHPLGAQLPGLAPIADGSPELWIETPERLQQLVDSAEYREGAGPDEEAAPREEAPPAEPPAPEGGAPPTVPAAPTTEPAPAP